jgi:ABC-type sugar transport system permease subunit
MNRISFKQSVIPWLFLLFPLILYLLIIAYPLIASFVLSFTEWSGMGKQPTYVALKNFAYLFSAGSIITAIKNNLIWLVLCVPIPTVLGFVLAYILRRKTKINMILRSMFYLPLVISNAVMAIMWLHVYAPQHGLIAQGLRFLHLTQLSTSFLTNPNSAIVAISFIGVWHGLGFPLILYLAAIQDIPQDLLEAADLDGASTFYKIIRIVIPFVQHATIVVVALGTILSMKVFDLVYLMTGGYYKNDVLGTYLWRLAFDHYQLGRASAVAVVQFLIVCIVVIPYLRWQYRTGEIEI